MKSNILRFALPSLIRPPASAIRVGSRTTTHDPRWPLIVARLTELRDAHRFSVRIVDADCAAGALLLDALRLARTLGFTAIEGRGIDGSPALIGRARASARRLADPAIGVTFEVADMVAALRQEQELPADIVLWHGPRDGEQPAEAENAAAEAGNVVITDHGRVQAQQAWI